MVATENLKGKPGVYCAIHRDSLMCYVGSSCDVGQRRNEHVAGARNGGVTAFNRAVRKLGAESFDFEVLELCPRDQLKERENLWLRFYQSASTRGLNTLPFSNTFKRGEVSKATRERISASKRGNVSPRLRAHLEGLALKNKGVKRPLEAVEKVRRALTGRKLPREQVERMKAIFAGRKPSAEMLAAAKAKNLGRPRTAECRAKIKRTMEIVWAARSEQQRAKIEQARLNTRMTNEQRKV
jgi:group I intron endonuclease